MKHTYSVTGMTCSGCAASVAERILKIEGVSEVDVSLEKKEALVTMQRHIPLSELKSALPEKYSIDEKSGNIKRIQTDGIASVAGANELMPGEKSKWQQLKPLFLIFLYLFVTAFLLNYREMDFNGGMLDFMGLFYVVFSFFKLLDLKGFPDSFRMYDPLAKAIPVYGWVYPFLEVVLGLMFLFRFQMKVALIATLIVLGITTLGVAKTLLDKRSIRCACLGTALKLPMTEATFIENAIMLIMATTLLIQMI